MDSRPDLLARQSRWLDHYRPVLRIRETGSVVSVGDGIAWVAGLPSAAMDDTLDFSDGSRAMVFDLNERLIGAVLLRETEALTAGTAVQCRGRRLGIPAGDALLGRIIDPTGEPLDGGEPPAHARWQPQEAQAPPITARDFVHERRFGPAPEARDAGNDQNADHHPERSRQDVGPAPAPSAAATPRS